MDFTNEHKEEREFGNFFPFGVHKVKIIGFYLDKTEGGKEFLEVGFTNEEGTIEDKARVWFSTDKAVNYSFNILKGIFVHNAPEAKKDQARKLFDAVENTEKLAELLTSKLIGKEMWFTKYPDPERTYTGGDGRTYQSINKNIYGYPIELNQSLMPAPKETAGEAAGKVFSKADEAEDVPFKGGGTQKSDWA